MVRYARAELKASPRPFKTTIKSALKATGRSAVSPFRPGHVAASTTLKHPPNAYKYGLLKSRLAAIREGASEQGTPQYKKPHSASVRKGHLGASNERYQNAKEADLFHFDEEEEEDDGIFEQPDSDDDDEDDMAEWDESTLVAMLQDESSTQSETSRMNALADSLQGPMASQSKTIKDYLATTLIPATKRVKEVHDVLDEKVDVMYATGLLAFDEACKKFEKLALKDEAELRHAYSQSKLKELFLQLEEAYQRREQLWDELEETITASVERARSALEALPDAMSAKIVVIEKKAKELDKTDTATAKERMLRGLIGKF